MPWPGAMLSGRLSMYWLHQYIEIRLQENSCQVLARVTLQ